MKAEDQEKLEAQSQAKLEAVNEAKNTAKSTATKKQPKGLGDNDDKYLEEAGGFADQDAMGPGAKSVLENWPLGKDGEKLTIQRDGSLCDKNGKLVYIWENGKFHDIDGNIVVLYETDKE